MSYDYLSSVTDSVFEYMATNYGDYHYYMRCRNLSRFDQLEASLYRELSQIDSIVATVTPYFYTHMEVRDVLINNLPLLYKACAAADCLPTDNLNLDDHLIRLYILPEAISAYLRECGKEAPNAASH